MYIAKREEIQRRREERKLTMCKLATECGFPTNAVWRMEKADYRIHPIRAKVIAAALNCDVADIFMDEKECTT